MALLRNLSAASRPAKRPAAFNLMFPRDVTATGLAPPASVFPGLECEEVDVTWAVLTWLPLEGL